jgi:hypothetical protein
MLYTFGKKEVRKTSKVASSKINQKNCKIKAIQGKCNTLCTGVYIIKKNEILEFSSPGRKKKKLMFFSAQTEYVGTRGTSSNFNF